MASFTIAIPSDNPGGLEAGMGAHFGHCDIFTLVELDGQDVKNISTLGNNHDEGGCLAPVGRLAENNVNIMLAGGMGMRPLMGFQSAGISVFHAPGFATVGEALTAFKSGALTPFSTDFTCKGHGGSCGGHH